MNTKGILSRLSRTAACIALAAGAQQALAQDIKIGFNGDLSASPSAQSGQAAVLGLKTAIEDINAAGGLLGRKVVLVVRDDLSQPPKSIQNMTDLIDNEKVVAVFGPTNSGNALAWKHIPNQKKVPVMGAIGSGTDITKPMRAGADNYMFRVGMVDREQVEGVIGYLKRNPKVKNVGFMIETTGYGQSALKDLEEVGAAQGVKAVAVEKFGVADTDMTSQLNKLKSAGVDTVVIWAQSTPIAHVFRSMEKINWFPLTLTSWAADNIAFYDTAGKTLSEKPFFLRTITDNRSPAQQKLYDRVSGQMTSPTAFGFLAHAYDGMHLMAMAVKQAGSTDGDKLRQALENLQGTYDGAMKTYTKPFSPTGHDALLVGDYKWAHWQDGKLVPYADDVTRAGAK
ncbi:ABC transporter substrate-binding protein [Achromobacter sp. Marseille-Q0513]|jgi:branched-chain amino acid transport system substrate-binding protein|uniref:ABC transporter substrate-binding protein n=1 Tax=unclassified Achromobacter TaxID=2626865 RepID=UPI000CD23442|nr:MULTISPECIES: ABC transporter substrate-binding protein [unclassified Achromobacter]AUT45251.1 branched-chain amino acid ABC transporter substrate-binding protein [Achromobacter sp. AONIH1]MBR8652341.1 ABC transporter substrate-binding protein [Achromobacter sp. Marseille-Q0513]